jgi:hypothetical protein
MKSGGVESPNAEIAVSSVDCALSFTSAIVTGPGFVCAETITSGADVFLGQPTLVSSTFQINGDGIDLTSLPAV